MVHTVQRQKLEIEDNMTNEHLSKIASFYNTESNNYDTGYSALVCKAEDHIVAEIIQPFLYGNVLDIGAGSGLLCEIATADNYYGIELSSGMTTLAKTKFPENNFSVADMHKLPFPDNFFDNIISLYGPISYSLSPSELIAEIKRVLKPGGHVALMPYTLRVGHGLDMGGYSTATEQNIEKKFYTEATAKELLAGFAKTKVQGINFFLNTEIRFSQEMNDNNYWTEESMIDFLKKERGFQDNLKPEMARHMIVTAQKPK